MNGKRIKRNLRKNKLVKNLDVTETILASYGVKRQKLVEKATER